MTEPARTAPGPTRLPVSLSAAGNPAQELDRVLLPWLRVATAGALDAEFDRLESPSSEGLHGLFEVELLTIRGIGGCPVLWNPLRRWLNRHMPAVFEGKVFSGTAGYNQFAAGRQGLFFGVRRRPGDPRHVIIDYNVSGTPDPCARWPPTFDASRTTRCFAALSGGGVRARRCCFIFCSPRGRRDDRLFGFRACPVRPKTGA